jgi:hypothetical protein
LNLTRTIIPPRSLCDGNAGSRVSGRLTDEEVANARFILEELCEYSAA